MFAIVRAFVGLILMKNTHAPVSCISFVSVINTLGFVLMLVACAPPGPSLTCSTVIKIVKKKLVYFVMLRLISTTNQICLVKCILFQSLTNESQLYGLLEVYYTVVNFDLRKP